MLTIGTSLQLLCFGFARAAVFASALYSIQARGSEIAAQQAEPPASNPDALPDIEPELANVSSRVIAARGSLKAASDKYDEEKNARERLERRLDGASQELREVLKAEWRRAEEREDEAISRMIEMEERLGPLERRLQDLTVLRDLRSEIGKFAKCRAEQQLASRRAQAECERRSEGVIEHEVELRVTKSYLARLSKPAPGEAARQKQGRRANGGRAAPVAEAAGQDVRRAIRREQLQSKTAELEKLAITLRRELEDARMRLKIVQDEIIETDIASKICVGKFRALHFLLRDEDSFENDHPAGAASKEKNES